MYINVPVSDADKERIKREEEAWNAPKMIAFGGVFLGICLVILYSLANLTTWMGTHKP